MTYKLQYRGKHTHVINIKTVTYKRKNQSILCFVVKEVNGFVCVCAH